MRETLVASIRANSARSASAFDKSSSPWGDARSRSSRIRFCSGGHDGRRGGQRKRRPAGGRARTGLVDGRHWRFARRVRRTVGGPCGFRRCFSFLRPLPDVTRHVVEALGDGSRGRRHLGEGVRRLPLDLPPCFVHQVVQPLLVLLKPGKVIGALLGHAEWLYPLLPLLRERIVLDAGENSIAFLVLGLFLRQAGEDWCPFGARSAGCPRARKVRNRRVSRGFAMRLRGVEPPRPLRATRPSTLRVYQFRHSRLRDRRL